MKRNDRIVPDGTRDILFEDCKIRRFAEEKLRVLFKKYSYSEVITPSIEFYDVFAYGLGRLPQEYLYTFTDTKGRLISLRADSTKPIARLYSARLQGLSLPVRLFYNQSVFHRNISFYKKRDENTQMGVELIGIGGIKADIEILTLAAKGLYELFGEDFRIEIGHSNILNYILSRLELDEQTKTQIRQIVASKNYPKLEQLLCKLPKNCSVIKKLPEMFGSIDILDEYEKEIGSIDPDFIAKDAVLYLRNLLCAMERQGFKKNILLDLATVNEYDYYTGIMFKGFSSNGQEVLSGGRYDTLYNDYDLNIEAVGFACDIDAICDALKEEKRLKLESRKLVVVFASPEDISKAFEYIDKNETKGVKYEISLFDTLEETLFYAKKRNAKVIKISTDEVFTTIGERDD